MIYRAVVTANLENKLPRSRTSLGLGTRGNLSIIRPGLRELYFFNVLSRKSRVLFQASEASSGR